MARYLIDHNPLTGESTWMDYRDGESLSIVNEQDVNTILDDATRLRNSTDYSRKGIKNDHWHYARIPNGVMLEMKQKHGIDMMKSPIDWKAVFKCINQHYPWLKTTEGTHA